MTVEEIKNRFIEDEYPPHHITYLTSIEEAEIRGADLMLGWLVRKSLLDLDKCNSTPILVDSGGISEGSSAEIERKAHSYEGIVKAKLDMEMEDRKVESLVDRDNRLK